MKKLVFAVTLFCMFSVQILAQEKRVGKLGFEYGFEMIDPGVDGLHMPFHHSNQKKYIYIKDFNCHRASILYRQPIFGGIYIEPQLSYYYMKYNEEDLNLSIGYPGTTGYESYTAMRIAGLVEHGFGVSLHLGYNLKLYNKLSVDLYFAPDYRYAIQSCNLGGYYDYLEVDKNYGVAIYDPGYWTLKGGVGVNYGVISLNFSYGKYVSDRFNINKDAMRPGIFTLALGFKFGL
ncbi:MAG: hypothetical protein Q4A54_08130 [Parabacteroides sp.]|nr:hypothetical protein [Parabacteroides sp.]